MYPVPATDKMHIIPYLRYNVFKLTTFYTYEFWLKKINK